MANRLIELMENLGRPRVVLLGDLMIDRYVFGATERISPEAPVPVVHFQREEYRLGGAGFVMAALAALGARVSAVGVVGEDAAGKILREHLARYDCDVSDVLSVAGRPTVLKTRILGSSEDRTPHQIVRLDYEDAGPLDAATGDLIVARVESLLASADLLCLEDYNKGVLSEAVCRKVIELARRKKIPVMVDPARISDYSKYTGATALKLNRPEAERSTRLPVRRSEHLAPAAEALLEQLQLDAVVITLNEAGAYLATRQGERRAVETRPRAVADGTGAGDAALAMLCVARASGADWLDAVALANTTAGLEVEKLGCVPVGRDEIILDLLQEAHEHFGKQRTLEQLLPELKRHRAAGKKIVFTNGCFDLIHLGHVKYFQFAKKQGDLLVVAVNTDKSIRRLKGEKRPIISEEDRVSVLEELESIDYLVRFDDDTPLGLIEQIMPDVLVKGADYAREQVVGWDVVEAHGGRVALAPLIDGKSTSGIVQRILEAYK